VPDFYAQGAKHEIKNIKNACVLGVYKVNKLRKSDASTNEIYKSIAPLFSTED
jgi:hypothetical protein